MSADRETPPEGFLARWSRLKTSAEAQAPAVSTAQPAAPNAAGEPPALPPLDQLTTDSDFRGFFHPKVDEGTRRAALRKLFSDPHFNVMDGLDVYIDDYTQADPIPAQMLAGLQQAQRIARWAEGRDDGEEAQAAPSQEPAALAPTSPGALTPPEAPEQPTTRETKLEHPID